MIYRVSQKRCNGFVDINNNQMIYRVSQKRCNGFVDINNSQMIYRVSQKWCMGLWTSLMNCSVSRVHFFFKSWLDDVLGNVLISLLLCKRLNMLPTILVSYTQTKKDLLATHLSYGLLHFWECTYLFTIV